MLSNRALSLRMYSCLHLRVSLIASSDVCKLCKAIDGLKQTPHTWNRELRQFLLQSGFTDSIDDISLFIFNNSSTIFYLLVYVDDLITTGNKAKAMHTFIQQLSQRFSFKDLGPLTYFLGVEITSPTNGLLLSQCKISFIKLT